MSPFDIPRPSTPIEIPVFKRTDSFKCDSPTCVGSPKKELPPAGSDKDCKACLGRGRANLAFYMACRICNGTGLDPSYQRQQELDMEATKDEVEEWGTSCGIRS